MKNPKQFYSRRTFVATMTGAGTAFMLNPLFAWAIDEPDPAVAAIVASIIGVDTHNHIDVPNIAAELPGPAIDLAGEMKKSGLSAICMTFAVDYQPLINPGDAYERFKNAMTVMDKALATNNIKRSLNLADLQAAHKKRQPTVIQSVEGGHFLEGKLERVKEAYDRGLRQLGLLHDNDASVPLGDIYTKTPQWGALTAFGADVIRECNRLGILVDLTHASNDTVNAALKVTTKPVVSSHTGLDTQLGGNAMMAKMMRPRLISKEQAKIIADAGGLIGVWTHLADTPMDYAQNIRAMVDVIGVDHVCIGTDTKLTPSYRSPNAGSGPGGPPNNNGQNGPGGGQNRERVGERTNKAWADQQTGFLYTVVDSLLKTGFTKEEIGKIGGGNFCRVFDAATNGHK
ncbi:dipeptidase [Spirosoma foliorum]|uniref:Membrane dipeptidase n=1 Tax=Spirosoma foliorum TaxID=2710596 RepID=A0A7G5H0U1_9BACT|nr:membrane dipeptidase [Spirosoma foliorum]QMW04733.1 membrane dipeptidase [Spirosoma foliorum]